VISGIVVAVENEDTILEVSGISLLCFLSSDRSRTYYVVKAFWETEQVAAQKEQEKRRQAVLKRWTKLVHGLRIRQRMREEYGAPTERGGTSTLAAEDGTKHDEDEATLAAGGGGGFLTGVEDVVQPYSLPRPMHVVFSSPPRSPQPDGRSSTSSSLPPTTALPAPAPAPIAPDVLVDNTDDDEEGSQLLMPAAFSPGSPRSRSSPVISGEKNYDRGRGRGMPKSMAELAAESAAAAAARAEVEVEVEVEMAPPPSQMKEEAAAAAAASSRRRASARARPKSKTPLQRSKRARGAHGRWGEDVSDVESVEDDEDEDEDGYEDGDGEDEEPRLGKRRRARSTCVRNGRGGGGGAVLASDERKRVLRPRKGKSAEQLAREREQELAVKLAMEDDA
jgi:xeroderma pigmentosum group C-complementing protein